MKTIAVTDATFDQEVLQSTQPVLVDLWAPWCGPCHQIAPALEEIAKETAGRFKIAKVNIDENEELTNGLGVRSIPTLLFFKNGELRDQLVGSAPKKMILARLEALGAPEVAA